MVVIFGGGSFPEHYEIDFGSAPARLCGGWGWGRSRKAIRSLAKLCSAFAVAAVAPPLPVFAAGGGGAAPEKITTFNSIPQN